MTEHEKLKEIIDLIGYEYINYRYYEVSGFKKQYSILQDKFINVDVREIIFTQEFKSKVIQYIRSQKKGDSWTSELKGTKIFHDICNHLDDPVQYLYNTLGL